MRKGSETKVFLPTSFDPSARCHPKVNCNHLLRVQIQSSFYMVDRTLYAQRFSAY